MTEAPAAAPNGALPGKPFRSTRSKPNLREQADLIRYLIDSYRPPKDGLGVSPVWLSPSQIEDLQSLKATIDLFDLHDARGYVIRQIEKKRKR